MKIRAVNASKSLLKVIKNPVTLHIPNGTPFYHITKNGDYKSASNLFSEVWETQDKFGLLIPTCVKNQNKDHGIDLTTEKISVSSFGLTSSAIAARVMASGENFLKIG